MPLEDIEVEPAPQMKLKDHCFHVVYMNTHMYIGARKDFHELFQTIIDLIRE